MTTLTQVTILTLLLGYASCLNDPQTSYGSDEASLLNTVHKLEQDISDLKSQSQITEQQHAAILTHVLSNYVVLESRFNATMDQLKQVAAQAQESDSQVNQTAYLDIQQLEQKIEGLESQIQTTDEKNAAVISNVLAQLTSSTAKQLVVQNQLNVTSQKLNTFTNEIEDLKKNTTLQASESSSLLRNLTGCLHQDIGFETTGSSFSIMGTLAFSIVSYNAGGGYNISTGVFTAPLSGTYLFWFNIVFSTLRSGSVCIRVNGHIKGDSSIPVDLSYLDHKDPQYHLVPATAGGTFVVSITANDHITLVATPTTIARDAKGSYGGILMNGRM